MNPILLAVRCAKQRQTDTVVFRVGSFKTPVPVVVRIVWENDGEEHMETEALGWTDRSVYVRLPDSRWRFTSVWLRAEDVRRQASDAPPEPPARSMTPDPRATNSGAVWFDAETAGASSCRRQSSSPSTLILGQSPQSSRGRSRALLIVAPNSRPSSRAAAEVNSPTFLGSVCAAASPACEEKNWPVHEALVGATASADEAGRSSPAAVTRDTVRIRARMTHPFGRRQLLHSMDDVRCGRCKHDVVRVLAHPDVRVVLDHVDGLPVAIHHRLAQVVLLAVTELVDPEVGGFLLVNRGPCR
jgi:hypothetical protein